MQAAQFVSIWTVKCPQSRFDAVIVPKGHCPLSSSVIQTSDGAGGQDKHVSQIDNDECGAPRQELDPMGFFPLTFSVSGGVVGEVLGRCPGSPNVTLRVCVGGVRNNNYEDIHRNERICGEHRVIVNFFWGVRRPQHRMWE